MKYPLVLFLVAIALSTPALAGGTYSTSTGAVFTQVQGPSGPGGTFGTAWKDPSGTIWSSNLGLYTVDYSTPFGDGTTAQDFGNLRQMVGCCSPPFKFMLDSPATEACAKIGGVLPTVEDYERLAYYFDYQGDFLSDQGRKDLWAIFPDIGGRWFWTASLYDGSGRGSGPFQFGGGDGIIDTFGWVSSHVRCINR